MSPGRAGEDGEGRLITLEGLDGSGKSTVIAALQRRHPTWTFTCEPTDSWYGDAVRRSVESQDADPIAELFLFIADHAEHLRTTIRPALRAGGMVVSDRYIDSRVAYQAVTLAERMDAPAAFIRDIHAPFTILPDMTVFLDVEPEMAADRSGGTNKFEQVTHLREVQQQYETIIAAAPERFRRVDASRSQAAVVDAVELAISESDHR